MSLQNPKIIKQRDYAGLGSIESAMAEPGHDGIIVQDAHGNPDTVVAFKPSQIKSASGNSGAFDAGDADINAHLQREGGSIEARLQKITGVRAGSNGDVIDRAAFDKAVENYSKLPETLGGKVMSTDVARELSPDYIADRTKSAETHEAASSFIKALWKEKLSDKPGPEASVVFTAGGTGAGKTTALQDAHGIKFADIVYDTNLNGYKSSLQKIQQALDSGRNVQVMYVYRDPVDAMRNGALKRAERQAKEFGTGRTVPISAHIESHVESLTTMRQLAEHFKDDPRFTITTYDNSFGVGNVRQVDLDSLKELHYDTVKSNVEASIKEAYSRGEISKETYKGFLGRYPEARVQGGERAGSGGEERGAGSDRSGSAQEAREGVSGRVEPQREGERADQIGQFSWEAVPSTKLEGGSWIHDATPEFKMAYTKAIIEAVGPAILDEFGIGHTGTTVGFGGWEGDVNPSVQEHLSKAEQHQLANAAATYGLLLKQDGVAYHTPMYGGKPASENGVHIQVGRPLTAAETSAVYDRMAELAQERFGLKPEDAQQFAPIPNKCGGR